MARMRCAILLALLLALLASASPSAEAMAWQAQKVDEVNLAVPGEWQPVPGLARGEGAWYLGEMGAKAQIWVMVSHKGQAGDFLSAIKVEGRKPSSLGGRPATLYQGRNLDGSQKALMVIADAPDAQGRWLGVVFGGRQLDAFANDVEQIIASLTFNQAARLPASAQAPVQPAVAEPPSTPQPPAPPEDDKSKEPVKTEDTSAVTTPAQEKKVEDATTVPDTQTQTTPPGREEPKTDAGASPDKTSAQTDTQDQQTPPAPTDPKATTPAKPEEPASRVWLVKKKGSADYVGRGEELKGDGSPDVQLRLVLAGPGKIVGSLSLKSTSGQAAAWDTIPDNGIWLMAVKQGGDLLNQADGGVSITLQPGANQFDLWLQDNNAFAGGKTGFTLTVAFKDGDIISLPLHMDAQP